MHAEKNVFLNNAVKYLLFLRISFKSQVIYRLTTVLNLCGSLIVFFVQFFLWRVLIASGIRQDVTFKDMITYVMITTLVHTLTQGNTVNELGASIRDGSVVMHLLRPVSFRLYLLSGMAGKNIYSALMTAAPILIGGGLFIGMPLPPSVPAFLVFIALILIGMFIMFELVYLTGLLAFWTQAVWFLPWYVNAGVRFFGGTVIPLWFYPSGLAAVSYFLPFRYISFEAVTYYLGKSSLDTAPRSLGIALLWHLLLFAAGHLLWNLAKRKMTINGG
jgi:ABC-2 type transport system permease protein